MSLFGAVLNAATPAVKTPVPMVGRSQGGLFGAMLRSSGTTQQLSAMETVGTVFGIVDKLATATSLVEWHLWRKAKSGKKEDRTEVTSHLALDIWNKPNDFFTRQELVECGQQHQELIGETWQVISRNPRAKQIPLELWPIRPDRMEPVPSAEKFLAGYIYRSPDGEPVPLERSDVLFQRRPDPNSYYRGLGPLRPILTDVDASRYAAEWNRNFFINSAEPGGIIEVPKSLSDDEFLQLRERWNEQHRGVANAHRVALLEHGKWIDRKYSMRDMQFVELRGVTSAAIRESFGFPKFMLGQVDDVNRASANASEAMYSKHLIVPRLERWKQMLNNDFLPLFGSTAVGLEFDYENPVPADDEAENAARTSKVQAVAALVPLGFKAKETLAAFDLPDIPFEQPAPAPAPVMPNGAVPGQKPTAGKPATDQVMASALARLTNQAPVDDPALARVQADWEQALAGLLAQWQASVTPGQREQIRAQVRERVSAANVAGLAQLSVDSSAGAELLLASLNEFAGLQSMRMADELAAQGAPVAGLAVPTLAGGLSDSAAATAGVLAAGLAAAAAREAVRAYRPGVAAAEVIAAVDKALDGLSDRALSGQLGGALSEAQNVARLATGHALETSLGGDPGDPNRPDAPTDDDYVPQVIYSASEVNDKNTCLAPEVAVTTRNGRIYAKDVTLDDELLTHAGRWVRPSHIIVSEVDEQLTRVMLTDGRSLRLTWDHPVLVFKDGGFFWCDAGDLAVGDLVVDQSTLQIRREVSSLDFDLGQSPDGVATADKVGGLPLVDVGSQCVPVGAIRLDYEAVADQKVDGPRSDLDLSSVGESKVLQAFTDDPLDTRLPVAGSVAPQRAIAGAVLVGWADPHLDITVNAVGDDWRSSADLATVQPLLAFGVAEHSATSLADCLASTSVHAARARAVVVPTGGGPGYLETGAAIRADLDGPTRCGPQLGAHLGVGELALDRAVDSAGSVGLRHDDPAHLASGRRVVRVSSVPGSADGAALAEGPLLDSGAAGGTHDVNGLSVVVATVSAVEHEHYSGEVFDFTVPGDSTFFAEGVLVHNCWPCHQVDGTEYESWIAAWVDYGGGIYRGCLGRDRCRGTVKATWNPAAGP